ncbi:Thioesterase domain-containing protein [Pleurotus pulmonarius]
MSQPRPRSVTDWISSLRIPSSAIAAVPGSAPDRSKEVTLKLLEIFKVGGVGFGTGIADRLVVTDVSIIQNSAEPLRADARVVCELEVTEDMANIAGNMHGGCSIYLVDSCSTLPLSAWLAAQPDRKNDSGVSQSINTVFHAPAPVGTKLRIISTSTMTEGAIFASRCQIWDVINHRLIASGVHLKMIASQPKPKL